MTLFSGAAFVTGAGSGIGRQVAISLAREGCTKIALLDMSSDTITETARLCSDANPLCPSPTILVADVRDEQSIAASVRTAIEALGRIDYAVNAAGVFGPLAPSHLLDPADFDNVTAVNYRGTWLCARAELGQMITQEPLPTHDGRPGNRGVVVNVASNLSLVSRHETPAYNASKSAILSLTKSDAIDYSKHNIRVNCVCPGLIDTPMTKDVPADDPIVQVAPMKRMGTLQEVADAVLFLCSSKATFIQGAPLSVDGGYVIN